MEKRKIYGIRHTDVTVVYEHDNTRPSYDVCRVRLYFALFTDCV